ncbi:hypothetical protein CTI12_AA345410 [Artemisia annua]|uniref:Uncharacterized protein n=1 Tax=Artemisia annua TaxID=35608 RepID=A0A2U1MSY3_ARTAN|nr:hypothetical protein CTI12_AA345410 [Artemisia annua]
MNHPKLFLSISLSKHSAMEIAPAIDFDFKTSTNYGYKSAPSTPRQLKELYCDFDELLIAASATRNVSLATVPFAWEEKPGVPKTPENICEDDFSFDVSHFASDAIAAEDLFHGGIIKTVDPPRKVERERGRERGFSNSSRLPSSRSRRTRSLSPLGASDYRREQQLKATPQAPSTPTHPLQNTSRKWSFRDFFLFRSASDGRAMDKDPLKKYSTRNSSESGSVSKRRSRVSAHELHYNLNRANSNEMKKKTYLPYKQGILGGLSFNP